ncbi:uncharacterized protein LOC121376821 [Gigantopelta aegis]|uniref:uncharacterized protein LOC121376821 n=1 Tax=Gigantopelta aegis TaxID=1735272 RepID=UPI001B888E9B|nr:uncharacterized protein LOC121376821 [Gigantopelta aegis]
MALSKESQIEECMDDIKGANLESAVSQDEWLGLVNEYFVNDDKLSDDDDDVSDDDDNDELFELLKYSSENNINKHKKSCNNRFVTDHGCTDFDVVDDANDVDSDDEDEDDDDCPVVVDVVKSVLTRFNVHECVKVSNFTCNDQNASCKLAGGKPCYLALDKSMVLRSRSDMQSLTADDRDMVLMGQVSVTMRNLKMTKEPQQRAEEDDLTFYMIEGTTVCTETFKFVNSISQKTLSSIISYMKEHGFVPRHKKSGGRRKEAKN